MKKVMHHYDFFPSLTAIHDGFIKALSVDMSALDKVKEQMIEAKKDNNASAASLFTRLNHMLQERLSFGDVSYSLVFDKTEVSELPKNDLIFLASLRTNTFYGNIQSFCINIKSNISRNDFYFEFEIDIETKLLSAVKVSHCGTRYDYDTKTNKDDVFGSLSEMSVFLKTMTVLSMLADMAHSEDFIELFMDYIKVLESEHTALGNLYKQNREITDLICSDMIEVMFSGIKPAFSSNVAKSLLTDISERRVTRIELALLQAKCNIDHGTYGFDIKPLVIEVNKAGSATFKVYYSNTGADRKANAEVYKLDTSKGGSSFADFVKSIEDFVIMNKANDGTTLFDDKNSNSDGIFVQLKAPEM